MYSKIVKLFDTSIKNGIPRKGDDTLFSLFRIIYPEPQVQLLPDLYNLVIMGSRNGKDYSTYREEAVAEGALIHLHEPKPWNVPMRLELQATVKFACLTVAHFVRKWHEFVASILSFDELKQHFPKIMVHINESYKLSQQRMPLFYWYDAEVNFGDQITPYFLQNTSNSDADSSSGSDSGGNSKKMFETFKSTEPNPSIDRNVIVSTGSVYRLVNSAAIVCGSGIRDLNQDIKQAKCIRSVRGPLTRRRALAVGDACPRVYGDPALLLPFFYKPAPISRNAEHVEGKRESKKEKKEEEGEEGGQNKMDVTTEKNDAENNEEENNNKKYKFELAIIPHTTHFARIASLYRNDSSVLVIDLATKQIESVIDQIMTCERAVSSSLHGIIVCHAYDIPVSWIVFDDNLRGDNCKFFDHFAAVGLFEFSEPLNSLPSVSDIPKLCIDARKYKYISPATLISQIPSTPHNWRAHINPQVLYDALFFDGPLHTEDSRHRKRIGPYFYYIA